MDSSNNNNNNKPDWMVLSSDTIMNGLLDNQTNNNNNNNTNSSNNEFNLGRSNTTFNGNSNLSNLLHPSQPSMGTLLKQESNIFMDNDSWNLQKGLSFSNLLQRSTSTVNNNNNNGSGNGNSNGSSNQSSSNTSFMDPHQQNIFNNLMNNMQDFHAQSQQQMQIHTSPNHNSTTTTTSTSSGIRRSSSNSINPYLVQNTSLIINNNATTPPLNSSNSNSNANTYEDDDEDTPLGDGEIYDDTPSTPPSNTMIPWGNSEQGSSQSGFYKQNTFSNILGQLPMDSIPTVVPPSEYESSSKFQRTGTLTEESMIRYNNSLVLPSTNSQLAFNENLNLNILQQHTTRLTTESELIRQSSNTEQNKSFIMSHYDTGTVPISSDYYNNLLLRYNQRPDLFSEAKARQRIVIQTNNLIIANELHNLYTTMKKDIDEENSELRNLLSIRILEPADLRKIREAIEGLKSHLRIVDVLMNELRYVLNKKRPECCVGLILIQQPSSQVIFRGGKGIAETFKVKLICGVIEPDSISSITASIDKRESASSIKKEKEKVSNADSKSTASLENAEAPLSAISQECELKNLKINVSTRMTPSHLKFSAYYRDSSSKSEKLVVSYPSSPLVVITNESQWAEAAGKLLSSDAFGDREEISWELFANVLHTHILKVTNQDQEIKRKLRSWEFDYIQKNYFNSKTTITKSECKTFWSKFGAILQSIHFKRHIASLWHQGLIYGLITKNECNAYLLGLPEGSFLIRFSDSVPGSFAVAYVTNDENDRVKHYLVKPDDIGANKSLPDFLRERYQFKTLYVVDPAKRSLSPKSKDDCLESFYSKNKTKTAGNPGYVSGL